jgi:hypothetical protein
MIYWKHLVNIGIQKEIQQAKKDFELYFRSARVKQVVRSEYVFIECYVYQTIKNECGILGFSIESEWVGLKKVCWYLTPLPFQISIEIIFVH